MKLTILYVFLLIMFNVSVGAFANDEGVKLYRLGLFSEARNYFRHKYELGDRSDELKLNYALSLYQVGEYSDAKSILVSMVTEDLNSARVLYALANTELELGNVQGAIDLFTAIYLSGDPDFAEYAKFRISELNEVAPKKPLRGFVSLFGGKSDDVVGLDEEVAGGTVDNFHELTILLSWETQLPNERVWATEVFAFQRKYDLEYEQDFLVYMFRGGSEDALGDGILRWRIGREESYLGKDGYLATTSLSFDYDMPTIGGYLGVGFERGYNEALSDQYSHVSGTETTWELSYSASITENDSYFFKYSFDKLKRANQGVQDIGAELAVFSDASSERHALALDFSYQITRKIGLSIDVEHAEREYLGKGASAIYDQARREDSQSSVSISAVLELREDCDLFIMYSEIKNSSSIAVYDYDYGVSKIGIGWSF
jgi:hypothetical protein